MKIFYSQNQRLEDSYLWLPISKVSLDEVNKPLVPGRTFSSGFTCQVWHFYQWNLLFYCFSLWLNMFQVPNFVFRFTWISPLYPQGPVIREAFLVSFFWMWSTHLRYSNILEVVFNHLSIVSIWELLFLNINPMSWCHFCWHLTTYINFACTFAFSPIWAIQLNISQLLPIVGTLTSDSSSIIGNLFLCYGWILIPGFFFLINDWLTS